jgi:NAD(P)-dependent dehydrogenase (short-subunit alcohol dehydrogenase family)
MKSTNKVWLVTGASKGIGLVLSQRLLAAGHRVAGTSRKLSDLTKVLGDSNQRFLPIEMDVQDEKSVGSAVKRVRDHFGALDVVVNNAGYGQIGAVEEVSDEEARLNFGVNVFGVLNVLRATLPHLRTQRSGHVFNISSVGGFTGAFSGWGVYCATKFALSGLTESLHADLGPLGVKTTLVYPGYFRTEFLSKGSVGLPARRIADYEGARASERQHLDNIDGNQAGDPAKLADALIRVYELESPPLHLFLGSDAVAMAETKQREVAQDVAAHRALSVGTDF